MTRTAIPRPSRKTSVLPAWPLVIAEWIDAACDSGWHSTEDVRRKDIRVCATVGWLTETTRHKIVLVPSIGGNHHDDDWADAMTIPRQMVRRITVVRKATTP